MLRSGGSGQIADGLLLLSRTRSAGAAGLPCTKIKWRWEVIIKTENFTNKKWRYADLYNNFSRNVHELRYRKYDDKIMYRLQDGFRRELVDAFHECADHGRVKPLRKYDGFAHEKTTLFLERLADESDPTYQVLRDNGLRKLEDFLYYVSYEFEKFHIHAFTPVWAARRMEPKKWQMTYEVTFKLFQFDMYLKLVFKDTGLEVDIHSQLEDKEINKERSDKKRLDRMLSKVGITG